MGQVNIKKTDAPSTPDTDRMGLYFDAAGNAYKIDESGTMSPLTSLTTLESISDVPPYPNDGNQHVVVELDDGLSWELYGGGGGGTSTPFEESFLAAAAQTNFTLAQTPAAAWVLINGAAQAASTWSLSGDDLVLSTPSTAGDEVEVYYLTDAAVAGIPDLQQVTTNGATTDIPIEFENSNAGVILKDDVGDTTGYVSGDSDFGVRVVGTTDGTTLDKPVTIAGTTGLILSDVLALKFNGAEAGDFLRITSEVDINGNQVFAVGSVALDVTEYTETFESTSDIALTTAYQNIVQGTVVNQYRDGSAQALYGFQVFNDENTARTLEYSITSNDDTPTEIFTYTLPAKDSTSIVTGSDSITGGNVEISDTVEIQCRITASGSVTVQGSLNTTSLIMEQQAAIASTGSSRQDVANGGSVVTVFSVDDLPTPSAGWHTLADDTIYKCVAPSPILLGTNGIMFGDNSHIISDAPAFGTFVHAGTGFMFDNNTNDLNIDGCVAVSSLGKFINFDGQSATKLMICKNVSVFADGLGVIRDVQIAFINDYLFDGFTDGWEIQGTNGAISISTGRFRDYVNKAIDFGTSVSDDIRVNITTFVEGQTGSYAISGLASSGNVTNRALVDGCIFNGDGDALENINHCDLQWEFKANTGDPEISDSKPNAATYIADGDETPTVISGGSGDLGNPIVISGTWTTSTVCRFTADAAGRLTYTGLENSTMFVTSKLEVAPATGSNVEYWFYFRKNGSTLDLVSRDLVTADSNSPRKIMLQTEMEFSEGDYVEIVIENRTNTTNAEIDAVNFIVG